MRASKDLILREVAGEYMLVPVGAAAARFNGLINLNEIGSFLFRALAQEQTEQSLVDLICGTYAVDSDTARRDLVEFLDQLREIGGLEEDPHD